MNWSRDRLAMLVALLLIASAVLFAAGSIVEHAQGADQHTAKVAATSGHTESGSGGESAKGQPEGSAGETTHHARSENIAGVNPESWPFVALAVAVAAALAAIVWRRPTRRWLSVVAVFGILFAAADVRELLYQLDESRTAVATIAGFLIGVHLLIAACAVAALTQSGESVDRSIPEAG